MKIQKQKYVFPILKKASIKSHVRGAEGQPRGALPTPQRGRGHPPGAPGRLWLLPGRHARGLAGDAAAEPPGRTLGSGYVYGGFSFVSF